MTVEEFDAALAEGPYAWPGGYPYYFITRDGAALSFSAADANSALIRESIATDSNDGWQVTAKDVNWEDGELLCDHTGDRIESAYAEEEEEIAKCPRCDNTDNDGSDICPDCGETMSSD